MTSEKSVLTESRLNDLITGAGVVLAGDWTDFGAFSASWAKVGGAFYRYKKVAGSLVVVQIQNLTVGTTTNGTTILSSANGLPAGFRLGSSLFAYFPIRCDVEGTQTAAFYVGTDGHMECYGIGPTAARVDAYFTFHAEQ